MPTYGPALQGRSFETHSLQRSARKAEKGTQWPHSVCTPFPVQSVSGCLFRAHFQHPFLYSQHPFPWVLPRMCLVSLDRPVKRHAHFAKDVQAAVSLARKTKLLFEDHEVWQRCACMKASRGPRVRWHSGCVACESTDILWLLCGPLADQLLKVLSCAGGFDHGHVWLRTDNMIVLLDCFRGLSFVRFRGPAVPFLKHLSSLFLQGCTWPAER